MIAKLFKLEEEKPIYRNAFIPINYNPMNTKKKKLALELPQIKSFILLQANDLIKAKGGAFSDTGKCPTNTPTDPIACPF